MKKYIAGIATGVILSCTVALAVNYTATENTFPIQLNGENVNVEGYNIDNFNIIRYNGSIKRISALKAVCPYV